MLISEHRIASLNVLARRSERPKFGKQPSIRKIIQAISEQPPREGPDGRGAIQAYSFQEIYPTLS